MDAVPLVRLRFLGVGGLRRAVARGPAGGGAEADRALAAGVLCVVVPVRGDGAEPDAERVPAVDGGAAGGAGGTAPTAPGDPGRGSVGGGRAEVVVRARGERRDAVGEHVRDHGDHGPRELPGVGGGRCARHGQPDRSAHPGLAGVRAGRARRAGAGGGDGGDVYRWRRCRPRLPEPSGADGGALRGEPVPRRGPRADVPDGRPGPLVAGRQPGVPGPGGRAGQAARFPDRAGRDRGEAVAVRGRAGSRSDSARRHTGRAEAGGVLRERRGN